MRLGPYLYRLPPPVLPVLPRLVPLRTIAAGVSSAIAEAAETADGTELDEEEWPEVVPDLEEEWTSDAVADLEEEEWPDTLPDLEEEWPDTLPDLWTCRSGSLLTRWRTSTRSRLTRCRWPSNDDAILFPYDDTMFGVSEKALVVTSRIVKL